MDGKMTMSRRSLLILGGAGLGALTLSLAGCTGDGAPTFDGASADAKESPMLTERVKAGTLPELSKRLPKSPMVVEPVDGVGTFGGTLQRAQTSATDAGIIQSFAAAGLIEWTMDADGAQPSLAEKYSRSDDNRVYRFTIRSGLKWSDGEPFTADDVLFAIQNWLGDKRLVPAPPVWFADVQQTLPKVSLDGDDTVVVTFKEPFALFERYMCHPAVSMQIIKPKHYLSQFHPDFADPADVDAAAAKAGFDSWDQYFADRDNQWTNPERPVVSAFLVTQAANAQSGTAELERNPYFWKTDPDGRQLPYIDHIQVQVLDQSALDLRAANGDLDFQGSFVGYNSTQVFLRNADQKGFSVLRWKSVGSLLSVCPNLSHKDDGVRDLMLDEDFRKALSFAIDREEMNKTLLGGLGIIRQPSATESSDYDIGAGETAISFDRARAEELLDGLGLEKQGDQRRMKDGRPLEFTIIYVDDNAGIARADALQMVAKHWAAVGLKANLRPVDSTLYAQLRSTNDFDFDGTTVIEDDWDLEPVWYVPNSSGSHSAPAYGLWYATGGEEGMAPPDEIKQLMDTWDRMRTAPDDDTRIAAGKEIMNRHDEKVYMIGLMKLPFVPIIVAGDIMNVRDDQPQLSFYYGREGITKPEQVSFSPQS